VTRTAGAVAGPSRFLLHTASGRAPRILLLGAHPDDIEIGCGATILSLLAMRPDVECRWIVFSGDVARRVEAIQSGRRFLRRAARKEISVLAFRDRFFPAVATDIKTFFEQIKAERSPDLIFTHRRDDRHQDHRVISELTWNTFRSHCILEFEIPKYDGDLGHPNFFVPVTKGAADSKVRGLMTCFPSQRSRHWFTPETFLGLMRLRGVESGSSARYAEAFHASKIVFEP
jgi:LmbE family N-acetylglucosaminyl deacetylase